jgi:hypothetical protein
VSIRPEEKFLPADEKVSNMPWTLQVRALTKKMQGKEERVEQKKNKEDKHI